MHALAYQHRLSIEADVIARAGAILNLDARFSRQMCELKWVSCGSKVHMQNTEYHQKHHFGRDASAGAIKRISLILCRAIAHRRFALPSDRGAPR
jgi:hypothetical protein